LKERGREREKERESGGEGERERKRERERETEREKDVQLLHVVLCSCQQKVKNRKRIEPGHTRPRFLHLYHHTIQLADFVSSHFVEIAPAENSPVLPGHSQKRRAYS